MPVGRGVGRTSGVSTALQEPELRSRYNELQLQHEDLFNQVLVLQGRLLEIQRLLAGILNPESKE